MASAAKLLLYISPAVLLVTYGQIVLKWRMNLHGEQWATQGSLITRLLTYLQDPYILTAYLTSLIGSFAWLFAIARLPLAQAFPIYLGLIFALVIVGSAFLLHEPITPMRLLSITLIMAGVVIGARA